MVDDIGRQPRAYRADPYAARTDLLLEGVAVLKYLAAAAVFFGITLPAVGRPGWLLLPAALLAVAAVLVAFGWLAEWLAVRRGRVARPFRAVAVDALAPLRRYWFVAVFPILDGSGLPLLVQILCGTLLIGLVEWVLVRIARRWT